jgi:KUP system potassium uptake protein
MDVAFFSANVIKIENGGWFPLLVGGVFFTMMTTWHRGRKILDERLAEVATRLDGFVDGISRNKIHRVPGTAVFLSRTSTGTPSALLQNLKHNSVLHETVVFLTIITEERPRVRDADRLAVEPLGSGLYRVTARYGFMESPDIPALLKSVESPGLLFDPAGTTYFLAKETIHATERPGMAQWRESLFGVMSRNARNATLFFHLPSDQVVELGMQIEM